jgi:hypothetical protein
MKTYNFTNEKGNVAQGVAKALRNGTVNDVRALFATNGVTLIESEKGLAVQRGVDIDGQPIYAVIAITMTKNLEVKAKVKTASKTPVEALEIPSIFAKE